MSVLKTLVIIGIIVLAGLVLLYIVPSVLVFFAIFYRKDPLPFDEYDLEKHKDHYFVPFAQRVGDKRAELQQYPMEEVSVTSGDGLTLRGVYFDNHAKRTAILFHGINAELFTNVSAQALYLYKQGFNVLPVYHRAHLKSDGRWTTIGLREQYDVLRWVDWAQAHGAEEVLLYGVSMGAATIAFASDKLNGTVVKGMVIDSGFYSVYAQMKRDHKKMHIPPITLPTECVMAKLFLKADMRTTTADSLKNTDIPALFIHGTNDETVEYRWGVKNYEACASQKELLLVDNAPHTLSIYENPTLVSERLTAFIHTYFNH